MWLEQKLFAKFTCQGFDNVTRPRALFGRSERELLLPAIGEPFPRHALAFGYVVRCHVFGQLVKVLLCIRLLLSGDL